VLTASASDPEQLERIKERIGVQARVRKPFALDELLAAVERLCRAAWGESR
jgi:DNA-binding response OmpR family regulator